MLPVVIGILWFSKLSIQYKCIHDEMQHFERPIYLDNESIFSKSVRDYAEIESTPVPLEIHFEFVSSFAYIKHSDIIKKQVLEEAKKEIKELLKVKRPQRPLLFPRDCKNNLVSMVKGITVCARGCLPQTRCKKYNLPDYMLRGCLSINNLTPKAGPGVPNVDIVLFVQAESCTGATLAWATFCKMDLDTNRPTAGIVNLCVNSFNGKNIRGSVNTIKHEIIHALGFSESAFPYFRDPSGKPYTKRNKFGFPDIVGNKRFSERVAKQFKVSRQSARLKYTKMMWGFQLPTILKSARQYFNCPSLQYMPLEDSGGGNRGFTSHFDELVTGVELMSPITHYGTGRLSVLTVAILEDTGWYVGDYLKVDKFYYGKNYGCHFVTNGCYEFIVSQMRKLLDIFPFCNTMYNGYSMRCSEDYEYVQVCSLHKYPTLDKRYQYLNAINGLLAEDGLPNQYAGSSVEAEHCPLYGLISYADKSNRICKDGHNTNKDASDQKKLVNYFGKDSICIPTSKTRYNVLKYSSWDGAYGAACLQYACDMKLKQLTVYSQKKLIATCSDIGKEHKFNDGLVKGAIICPSFKMTCTANTLKPIYENFANSIQIRNILSISLMWIMKTLLSI